MEQREKLKNILQFLRNSFKNELKHNTQISDIWLQLENLYTSKDNGNFNKNIISKVIDTFTKVECNGELTICLDKTFASDDFKCLEQNEVRILLNWIHKYINLANATDIRAIMHIFVNILKADVQHSKSILEIVIEPNKKIVLDQLNHIESDHNFETILSIIQCLDLILSTNTEYQFSKEQVDIYVGAAVIILEQHYKKKDFQNSELWPVFLLGSVSLLKNVCNLSEDYPKTYISELLGFVKAYWQFGISSSHTSLQFNLAKVSPSQQALYHSEDSDSNKSANTGGKLNKQRKPRAVVKGKHQQSANSRTHFSIDKLDELMHGMELKTSESDSSETENVVNREIHIQRQVYSKVRLNVILLFGCIARAQERCVMYRYWHSIFPHNLSDAHDHHILYVAQNDPNARCRSAALQITAQLLFESKQFLKQAESHKKSTNFLSFSANLALTVLTMYNNLLNILKNESCLPVLIQALKCLAVLVQATPFEHIEGGIIERIVESVRPFILHRDSTIQVSALMVLDFLILQQKLLPELAVAIGLPEKLPSVVNKTVDLNDEIVELEDEVEFSLDFDSEEVENNNITQNIDHDTRATNRLPTFWLLKQVIRNLSYAERTPLTTVRIESLQLLAALSAHFVLFINFLELIANTLLCCLKDGHCDIRLYAARCTDTLAYNISNYFVTSSTISNHNVLQCTSFWTTILPVLKEIICDTNDQTPATKASVFDATSNIGEFIFERQPHGSKMNLVIFLTGIGSDANEDILVRAAAVRALAVFAQYASLRGDLVFIENATDLALRLCDEGNQFVRIKAVWSLGNISDALVSYSIEKKANSERISDELFCRLIKTVTKTCSDNDKIRCNAVRALGNLVRVLNKEQLALDNYKLLFKQGIEKIIECIRSGGNAKVKWNACYAISNIIQNEDLFIATKSMSEPNWQSSLYPLLCQTIVNHANFKVRISATAVICNIQERSYFGIYFENFCCKVLQAIEQTFHLDNYYEYNHRDQLQEQLCLAISHLVNCANYEDIPMMTKHLTEHVYVVKNTWQRVLSRMVPEKAAPLLLCVESLQERIKRRHHIVGKAEINAIQFIVDIFK